MKRVYFCTKCHATLNPGTKVILLVEARSGRGLGLFSGQPGNYDMKLDERVHLRKGELVCFRCPVCQADLVSDHEPHFAELGMRMPSGEEGRVEFSRKYGEQATYFVTRERVRSYGANLARFPAVNFFGAGGAQGEDD